VGVFIKNWVCFVSSQEKQKVFFCFFGSQYFVLVSLVFVAAKKASSAQQLVTDLQKNEFPSSPNTVTFAEELFNRVPHKKTGLSVS
jgi:hypothetical protein